MDTPESFQDIDDDAMDMSESHQDDVSNQIHTQSDGELMDYEESANLTNTSQQLNSTNNTNETSSDNPSFLLSPGCENENENNVEELNIHQLDDINLDEYSDLLDLEIPPKIDETDRLDEFPGRLVIDTIELQNFKSYYGYKKIGPLSKGLSCIIGPNGSGKSNIFDCMLFVFDYNVKRCRAKNATEFIHKSSKEVCSFAKVTIQFKRVVRENEMDAVVEDSSFSIARQIAKSGKSTYYSNGTEISRDKLKSLLRDHGLGLDHDRFLILQGEVESISLLKPKGEKEDEDSLLGLLDDIIGTSRYKVPLRKVNAAISKLQLKVAAVNAKLRDSEKFKILLDEKIRRCIEQNRIMNGITDLKFQKLYIRLFKNRKLREEIKEKIEEYQNDMNDLTNQVTVLEDDIKRTESEQVETQKEFDQLQKKIKEMNASLNSNRLLIEEICNKMSRIEDQLKTREQKNDDLHKEITKLQCVPMEVKKSKEEAEKRLAEYNELEAECAKNKKEAEEAFEIERSAWNFEFDTKQEDVVVIQNDLSNLTNEKKKLEIKLEQLTSQRTGIEKQIKELELSTENLITFNASNMKIKEELHRTVNETEKEIAILRQKSKSYEEKIKESQENIRGKRNEYNSVSRKYDALVNQENISPTSETHKFLNSLNYPGFRGRLGDLVSVDKKYDIALSTLGGGSLEMYVVDEVKDAQDLVEQLKRNKKGRGTFICIDQMDKKYMNKKIKGDCLPGTVRAIDLLQNMPPEVFSCFFHVFKDSLVVDSIDSASQYTSQSSGYVPKMVTLDGNIFESTGKIIGGGKPVSRLIGRKDYTSVVKSECQKSDLKSKIDDLSDKIKDLQISNAKMMDAKVKADSEIRKKTLLLEDLTKIQQRNVEMAISSGEKRIKTNESNLIDLKRDLSSVVIDKDAYDKIVLQISVYDAKIAEKQEEFEEKEAQFNEVKSKVDELYNDLVNQHAIDYEVCLEERKACQDEIKGLDKKFILSSKNYQYKIQEQQKNEDCIQQLRNTYESLQEQEVETNESNAKLRVQFEEISHQMEEVSERMNNHNGLHNKKMLLVDLKNEVSKKNDVLKEDQNKLKEYKAKKVAYKEKIKNLKYVFYNSMNLLPPELIVYRNDEQYYSKRVDDAEKRLMESMDDEDYDRSPLLVDVFLEKFTEEEVQRILEKEEELDVEIKLFSSAYNDNNDEDVVSRYLEKQEVYLSNLSISRKVNKLYETLKEKVSNWTCQRIKEFDIGFSSIAKNVKRVYQCITLGGDAELEYCDMFDPYNFGIFYKIRPPAKAWRKLNNLSGGEKTLASLALIFGLHEYNPTPLYIMDEIDAALDFRNVAIIGRYIQSKTYNAQFIVVSLRKEMYELADNCVCIWKVNDETMTGSSDIRKINTEVGNWSNFEEIVSNTDVRKNFESLCQLFGDFI